MLLKSNQARGLGKASRKRRSDEGYERSDGTSIERFEQAVSATVGVGETLERELQRKHGSSSEVFVRRRSSEETARTGFKKA